MTEYQTHSALVATLEAEIVRLRAVNASLMQAARQALEALEKCSSALAEELAAWDIDPPLHHVLEASNACAPAITALREALEAAPEPAAVGQEPVAHLYCGGQFGNELDEWEIDPEQYQCDKLNERFGALGKKARIPLYATPQVVAAEQEPVGFMNAGHLCELENRRIPYVYVYPSQGTGADVPLYTAPQPARQQHTHEEKLCKRCAPVCQGGEGCFAGMPQARQVRMVAFDVQPARQPLPPASPCAMTEAEYRLFKLGWLEAEAAHHIGGNHG